MLTVKGTLPPLAGAGSEDVATREITLAITNPDGTVLDPVTIEKQAADTDFTFAVERNATITASLEDLDADGNASPVTTSPPFQAKDTFPPPAPGQIGFNVVGQTP